MQEVYEQDTEQNSTASNNVHEYANQILDAGVTTEREQQFQQVESSSDEEVQFAVTISDPIKVQAGSGLPFWVYKVTGQTNLPQYKGQKLTVDRRYSDFEWLQQKLSAMYPGCIVPPVPEKNVLGAVEKIFSNAVDSKQLVQYRQRALLKFMTRVVDHPILQKSMPLQQFLELTDKDFEQVKKVKIVPTVAVATPGLFTKTLTKEPEWIANLKTFTSNLEEGLKWMKTKLQELVQRRKAMSMSVADFAKGFRHLGLVEKNYEDSTMSRSLIEISQKAEQLSGIMTAQADRETIHLVETFTYYLGVIEAIRKAVSFLAAMRLARDNLTASLKAAQVALEKLQKGPPGKEEKIKLQEQAISDLQQKEAKASDDLKAAEDQLESDVARFDMERKVDFAYMLRSFAILQIEHSDSVRQHWESILPSVNLITTHIEDNSSAQ